MKKKYIFTIIGITIGIGIGLLIPHLDNVKITYVSEIKSVEEQKSNEQNDEQDITSQEKKKQVENNKKNLGENIQSNIQAQILNEDPEVLNKNDSPQNANAESELLPDVIIENVISENFLEDEMEKTKFIFDIRNIGNSLIQSDLLCWSIESSIDGVLTVASIPLSQTDYMNNIPPGGSIQNTFIRQFMRQGDHEIEIVVNNVKNCQNTFKEFNTNNNYYNFTHTVTF